MGNRAFWLAGGLFVYLLGCQPSITPENVKRIKVCQSTFADVKELFGSPTRVGQMGGHTTWEYFDSISKRTKLLVMFDNDKLVSDLAHNPAGMVELKSRCEGKPQ